MLCNFCQKETSDKSISLTPKRNMKVDFCAGCLAEYVYWSDEKKTPYAIHLYTTIGDKTYRWSSYHGNTTGHLWFIEEPGVPGITPNRKTKLLKTLQEDPHITPQNISDKIELIILFM